MIFEKQNSVLQIGVYSEKTDSLYRQVQSLYSSYNLDSAHQSLKKTYEAVKRQDRLTIAFIGKYNAGKSNIIKALTGDQSIITDSDVSTDKVTSYSWGKNILITDTPGLYTNENEVHDKLALEAIRDSDLLVYCITYELFEPETRDDFIKLATQYRSKMFLVINKMSKEAGEYDILVKGYTKTINKTLAPEYSLIDFSHAFIDALDYIEAIKDGDNEAITESHFTDFIDILNLFISKRGIAGKLLTPLTILLHSIEDASISLENDEHIKQGKALIVKLCRVIDEKKRSFIRESSQAILKLANEYISKGDEIARQLEQPDFSYGESDFQSFSEPIQQQACDAISSCFEHYAQEVDDEAKKVLTSEQAIHFFNEDKKILKTTIEGQGNNKEVFGKIQKGLGEVTSKAAPKVTSKFAKLANIVDGEEITIWTVNGSDLHELVKNIGHKLGHKFKPYEALRISEKIAKASKWLGPILTGVGTVVELVGILAEKRADRKLEEAKEGAKLTFKGMAEETELYYKTQIEDAAKEFDAIRNALEDELNEIEDLSNNNQKLRDQLSGLKKEIQSLVHEIEVY